MAESTVKGAFKYPVNAESSMRDKILAAIPPFALTLGNGLVTFAAMILNTFLFQEANAIAEIALITMLGTLASTMFNPVIGKFGDLFGRKRTGLVALIPYLISIYVIATAKSMVPFAIGYIVQKACMGAVSGSMTGGMVMDLFEGELRTKMQNYTNAMDALGGMVGPVIAGKLGDLLGAQATVRYMAIPLIIAWFVILFLFPDVRNIKKNVKIDYKGVITMWFFVGPLCFALAAGNKYWPWISWQTGALLVVAAIALVIFLNFEKKESQPLVNLKLFKHPAYVTLILACFFGGCTIANTYFNMYLNKVMQVTATQTGYISLLVILSVILNPFIGGYLAKTKNFRGILALAAFFQICQAISYGFFLKPNSPWWLGMLFKCFQTLHNCCNIAPLMGFLGYVMPADKRGMSIGVQAFFQTLAGSIYSALAALIMNRYQGDIAVAFRPLMIMMLVASVLKFAFFSRITKADELDKVKAEMEEIYGIDD